MNARRRRHTLIEIACFALLGAAACDPVDELECGEGTVEHDGACVVAGTGDHSGEESDGAAETSGGGVSGAASAGPGGDGSPNDDDNNNDDDGESEPGECVGEPWGCGQMTEGGDEACLAHEGCYPVLSCVGTEVDCLNFRYLSPECEAAPHCYSDTMQSGGTTLPGCWSYDLGCHDGLLDLESCESYGGTCHAANICEGAPEPCEYVASNQAGCEAQQGCFWKPA